MLSAVRLQLWLLLTSWVAALGVDRPPVQVVRARGEDRVDIARIREGDEAEAPGAARVRVLHDHTVDDLAEATEVV